MDLLPNEVVSVIYDNLLTVRDKIAFGATCRVYSAFIPDGFSKFARGFKKVIAEINSIEYTIFDGNLPNTRKSDRKLKGKTTGYTFSNRELHVVQGIIENEVTQAQARRYSTFSAGWKKTSAWWSGAGLYTAVWMQWDQFETGASTTTKYRVVYLLIDKERRME
jgi:hypothetical protein